GHIGFGAAVHQARAVTDRHRQQSAHRRASYPGRPIFSNSYGEAVAEPSAEISTPKKTTPYQRPMQWRARCTCIACHDLPLTVVMLRRDVDVQTINSGDRPEAERKPAPYGKTLCCPALKTKRGRQQRHSRHTTPDEP